jgi:hypothetical protein
MALSNHWPPLHRRSGPPDPSFLHFNLPICGSPWTQKHSEGKALKTNWLSQLPLPEALARHATPSIWRCFQNNQGKDRETSSFEETRNISFIVVLCLFGFYLFFLFIFCRCFWSYFCFGSLFTSSQQFVLVGLFPFLLCSFSISQLLISRALSYYLLYLPSLIPIFPPPFPTLNPHNTQFPILIPFN